MNWAVSLKKPKKNFISSHTPTFTHTSKQNKGMEKLNTRWPTIIYANETIIMDYACDCSEPKLSACLEHRGSVNRHELFDNVLRK